MTDVTDDNTANTDKEIWARIDAEAQNLRTTRTPLYVHKRIMDGLPADLYAARPPVPWYRDWKKLLSAVVLFVLLSLLIAAGISGMLS